MKQVATLLSPFLLLIPFTLTSTEASSRLPADDEPSTSHLYQVMAAEMALDREQPDVALSNYIAAAKETQDPAIASRATQIALTVGSLEDAIAPATIWANNAPRDLEAQITTAALYLRLNHSSEALPYLRNSSLANPQEAFQYFLILFRQLQEDGENQRIIDALNTLTHEKTTSPSAHLALTEIYLSQNKYPEALALSEEALKIDPHASIAIQLHTEALLRRHNKVTAKKYIDQTVKNAPSDLALQEYYVQFLYDNDYKKDAKKAIENILSQADLSSDELLQLARLSMQAQWFDLSKKILLRTSQQEEHKDLSYYFLARVAEMRNRSQEAIEWFKQVLTGPFHVLSQIRASLLLAETKRYDEALTLLSHTQATDTNESKQILLTSVDILNRANRFSDSLDTLNLAITHQSDDLELRYARSLVLDKLNKVSLAEEDLRTIIHNQPHHVEALNALGYILTNHTQRYADAEQYLQQALNLSPNNPSVLDSMGWLYYKTGRYPESLALLQKAQDIQSDAEIAAHLGEVLWYMKDFEGAKRVWNQALQQYPEHENILKAMKRLMRPKQEN